MGAHFIKHINWDDMATSGWKHLFPKQSNFLKKYKAENINAIELCQTASVVIYNYFVSCLCCDQETRWFRNILADIIGYEDCVFQINLKYYAKPKRHP